MKMFSMMVAAVLALGVGIGAGDAEAKRLGGAKSSGMQRQMDAPKPATPPTAAPATAAAPAAAAAPATAAQAAAKPRPSWMGPVAGLAAGLGLAALASHFGFGEELASMLMIGLLVMAVVVVVGLIMRKRAMAQQPALASAGGMRYQAQEPVPANRGYDVSMPASGKPVSNASSSSASIPADFDVAGFVRNAKVHFIRLQAANDAGNLDDIREFTTPEMFAELKMNFSDRRDAAQETDVVSIEADVIDVVEEASRYVVSVRFTGQIREEKNDPVESFDEVWHLVKPRSGNGGWLLAGIQQFQ
jgi:predicted lipid-binding transport protein (Tim44 family)